jgi:hypothetical protein
VRGLASRAFAFKRMRMTKVKYEGAEADQRMCPDAIRQTVIDRCNFDVGFQDGQAAFNVSGAI